MGLSTENNFLYGSSDIAYVMFQNGTAKTNFYQKIMSWDLIPEADFPIPKTEGELNIVKPKNLSDEDILEIEKKIFEQKKEELLKQYEGKYIALVDGLVIDSDIDFSELAKRVYATYGYRAIFMTRVIRNEKSHKISSPKFKSTKDI